VKHSEGESEVEASLIISNKVKKELKNSLVTYLQKHNNGTIFIL